MVFLNVLGPGWDQAMRKVSVSTQSEPIQAHRIESSATRENIHLQVTISRFDNQTLEEKAKNTYQIGLQPFNYLL